MCFDIVMCVLHHLSHYNIKLNCEALTVGSSCLHFMSVSVLLPDNWTGPDRSGRRRQSCLCIGDFLGHEVSDDEGEGKLE